MKKIGAIIFLLSMVSLLWVGVATAECDGAGVIICSVRDLSGVVLSDGDDNLTIAKGARVRGDVGNGVNAGAGNDTITNNGSISSRVRGIFGDVGADRIVNTGSITDGDAGIYGGVDADYLENSGRITAREVGIEGSDITQDADTVVNSGSINVSGGAGIITYGSVTNSGRITSLESGILGNRVTNSGRVTSQVGIALGGTEYDDLIINQASGLADGAQGIHGLDGYDRIENYGTVTGGIQGGAGDDTIVIYGGLVNGFISCGDGSDTLIFAVTVKAADYDSLSHTIEAAQYDTTNYGTGSVTINRNIYDWEYCEIVLNQLVQQ